MGRRLVIQGEDRYAVFSTICDDIILYDASLEGLVEASREEAADDAERDARDWCAGERPGRRHYTVEEAVEWVRNQHGDAHAEEVRAFLTAPLKPPTPFEAAVQDFPVGTKVEVQTDRPGWDGPDDKVVCGHDKSWYGHDGPLICVCLVSAVGPLAGWFSPRHLSVKPTPEEEETE